MRIDTNMLQINDILLARDFSPVSNQALRHAYDLAQRTGARLHVLYAEVLHETPFGSEDRPSPASDLDRIREELRSDGDGQPLGSDVEVVEAVVRDVAAGPAILNYASDHDVDLIALGTHGRRGVRRVLLGSVAEEVVRNADRPVLTVRGAADAPATTPEINRIVVPVDFSKYARQALQAAREFASLYDARIDALHVIEESLHPAFYVGGVGSVYDVEPDLDLKAAAKLRTFVKNTPGPDVEIESHVLKGRATRTIPEFADEQGADLVAMSTHGQTGLERFLLGSVAEKVVRHTLCPVLTVKAFGRSVVAPTSPEEAAKEAPEETPEETTEARA